MSSIIMQCFTKESEIFKRLYFMGCECVRNKEKFCNTFGSLVNYYREDLKRIKVKSYPSIFTVIIIMLNHSSLMDGDLSIEKLQAARKILIMLTMSLHPDKLSIKLANSSAVGEDELIDWCDNVELTDEEVMSTAKLWLDEINIVKEWVDDLIKSSLEKRKFDKKRDIKQIKRSEPERSLADLYKDAIKKSRLKKMEARLAMDEVERIKKLIKTEDVKKPIVPAMKSPKIVNITRVRPTIKISILTRNQKILAIKHGMDRGEVHVYRTLRSKNTSYNIVRDYLIDKQGRWIYRVDVENKNPGYRGSIRSLNSGQNKGQLKRGFEIVTNPEEDYRDCLFMQLYKKRWWVMYLGD